MSKLKNLKEWSEDNSTEPHNDGRLFLTPQQVRADPNFKDATDEEVENIIHTLHQLSLITYEVICREKEEPADNQSNKI